MLLPGTILLHDALTPGGTSLLFAAPTRVIAARTAGEVPGAVAAVKAALAQGSWLAGHLTYELGLVLEARLAPLLRPGRSPLLWLGVYGPPRQLDAAGAAAFVAAHAGAPARLLLGRNGLGRSAYRRAFARVKAYIAAGDIYQANLTLQAHFRLEGDPVSLYAELVRAQPVAHAALLDTGHETLLSLSPELFVRNRGGVLTARPMKGTLRRGPTSADDSAARLALAVDPKSRAENLMIVDLMRNDLGRIAEIGSVRVPELFVVETYRTLHQLTSGITARLRPDLDPVDALLTLFPCGSVTGAPKIRAMEVIAEVEAGRRGLYTGAIGYFAPDGDFAFNVAIRTATIGRDGRGRIGIGGGIVADSEERAEHDEALLKMRFLTDPPKTPALIETLLWQPGTGYWLLERHLARLTDSAAYLGITLAPGAALAALEQARLAFAGDRMRVRLLLDPQAGLSVTATALPAPAPDAVLRFVIAPERQDSANRFLYHKTSLREVYDPPRLRAMAAYGVDEVVFLNERGEVTEGSITSVFVESGGVLLTPALACGLLPGTLRAELLADGRAREAVLRAEHLAIPGAVRLGNSVRGLQRAELVATPATR